MMDSQENAFDKAKMEEMAAENAAEVVNNEPMTENAETTAEAAEEATEATTEVVETPAEAAEAPAEVAEEAAEAEVTAEAAAEETAEDAKEVKDAEPAPKTYETKKDVIERLKELAHGEEVPTKEEVEALKTAFYKLHIAEREARLKEYIDGGGDPEKYQIVPDEDEEVYKSEMTLIKEKRSKLFLQQEEEKQENLKKKLEIIEKVKSMATSPEEANRSYQQFKQLQQEWREIKLVPADKANELWRSYQLYVEQFYDLLKLNSEAREYDFKKNLEIKTRLCESAREEVWARFKAASTVINKKHQQHFDDLRAKEEENLTRKTALCEKVEEIAQRENKGASDWEKNTKEIMEIQKEWKTIGFAPQKMNVKIFERFRAACDDFFGKKAQYFKDLKQRFSENAEKKRALVEQAQALQDSTDWKSTGDKLIALQKEWKTIGMVPKKLGDQLWNDFLAACNKFFEARNAATSGTRHAEKENLEKKRGIIEKLKALLEEAGDDVQEKVQQLTDEYNGIGHVPFKEKDKLYKEYHEVLDKIYKELNISVNRRRLDNFRSTLRTVAERGSGALDTERARLMRRYESLKQEIQTYENNLGFLNASSKKGNSLIDEMNRKVQKLKDDCELVRQKIKAIDAENSEQE